MQEYDIIFLTNIPAFYKTSLYQGVGEHCRVLVIFLSAASHCRTLDFYQQPTTIDFITLSAGLVESRPVLSNSVALLKILQKVRAQLLVLGGWDAPEYWLASYCAKVQKRAIALESSCFESKPTGFKGFLKRLFVRKLDIAFPSGKPHGALLTQLGFQGPLCYTQGVGVFGYSNVLQKKQLPFRGRFLYVGRLAEEKNLSMLIQVFNKMPKGSLSIVGTGPLATNLEAEAGPAVEFLGHIPNEQLGDIYQAHDVLVLPSYREPWGLVVEEAIYHGLPVIVSAQVGCVEDWVLPYQLGLVCNPESAESLRDALMKMSDASVFEAFRGRVQAFDFTERDKRQERCYVEALE